MKISGSFASALVLGSMVACAVGADHKKQLTSENLFDRKKNGRVLAYEAPPTYFSPTKGKGSSKGMGMSRAGKGMGMSMAGKGMVGKGMVGKGMGMGMAGKGMSNGENSKGKGMGMMMDSSKGKGKGGKGGGTGKGGNAKRVCTNTVFETAQLWDEPLIEPNGTLAFGVGEAGDDIGQRWGFVDKILDEACKSRAGFGVEVRTRLNKGDKWHNEGTIIDLYGCNGYLAFEGPFSDSTSNGMYVITGGTGDFAGAKGYIKETFDFDTMYARRTVVIE